MIKYNLDLLSYGMELEFGDVPRLLTIPEHLGSWNNFETDIVNQIAPYYGIAADPDGKNPPVGGEINTVPTIGTAGQVKIFNELLYYFKQNDVTPTTSCVSQTHIHIHVPLLNKDLNMLKQLAKFIFKHQSNIVSHANQFVLDNRMFETETAIDFLQNDNGRLITSLEINRILKSNTVHEFIMNCQVDENPRNRHAINLNSLIDGTIEFRCFRGTLDEKEISDILAFCQMLVIVALTNGKIHYEWQFPKLNYDHELFLCWEKTKYTLTKQQQQAKTRKKMTPL